MTDPTLSVIICAHNSRTDYLIETVESLRRQTLDLAKWELVLVDNASSKPLCGSVDLSWHPRGRCVVEAELGLTKARIRGLRDGRGDLVVYVDDDNVLDADYLVQAGRMADLWPQIGVFGGNVERRLEAPFEPRLEPYSDLVGWRSVTRDLWSNVPMRFETMPLGAGMCVRRNVAEHYANAVVCDPRRQKLGRKGTALFGSEDHDLAFTAYEMGLGTGLFKSLRLVHLIPARRTELSYLLKMTEAQEYSTVLLNWIYGLIPPKALAMNELAKSIAAARRGILAWSFRNAKRKGRVAAARLIREWMDSAGESESISKSQAQAGLLRT